MNISKEVSALIRTKRAEHGLSQAGLAEKLNVKAQYISNVERDTCAFAPKYAVRLSLAIDTPLDKIKEAYKLDYSNYLDNKVWEL